jgi:hypothetical protein
VRRRWRRAPSRLPPRAPPPAAARRRACRRARRLPAAARRRACRRARRRPLPRAVAPAAARGHTLVPSGGPPGPGRTPVLQTRHGDAPTQTRAGPPPRGGGKILEEKTLQAVPLMEKLTSLCKRRGFVFQSSEIYGGLNSCYDYGPLGIELKNNIKNVWWRAMTYHHDNIEGVDASILMHPRSGKRPATSPASSIRWWIARCASRASAPTSSRTRSAAQPSKQPAEHHECQLTEPRQFNLMFKTFMGPVENQAAIVYLRPETAQGIFVNFLNV